MSKITPAQHEMLSKLASTIDGVMETPPDAQPTVKSLIKRGWLISIPVADGPSRLQITDAGRQAVAPPEEEQAAEGRATDASKSGDDAPTTLNAGPESKADSVAATPTPKGKIATLVELLRRKEGATVEAMMAATGWQAHSVRGAMSGSIKKALGLTITSEKTAGGRVYRIADEDAA